MQIKDQLQRPIYLNNTPKRIVCLVPSITELICDLGLESSLVGVTKFCVHPRHIFTNVAVVGGTKQVHYDKIRDLSPDIILCNKEENTLEMIRELEAIATVHISDINTVEDCLELIDMYGVVFNCSREAISLISKITRAKTDFEDFIKTQPNREVAYFIWKDPWMVAANDTFVNYMLSLNNFKNTFQKASRYPEIAMEKVYPTVELVLLSSEPYPFKNEHKTVLQPQFPNAKILLVDGEMFSWYGSRLVLAFDYFKTWHCTVLTSE
ncbi:MULTISPECIES: ABC transporter substrate-binding protein [Bizionia]|uniref:ABC transporter substrate-binding protein n=1 Tax=Bizionia algoritergicola TaxID=291187 RepID=A0A5D0QSV2_9FLAO|nr:MULTISPECIES: helical backbone metal receptor [Bizionia]OBX22048.1 cobalamin-binding protein [Bizionia sp. APA-3]TYB72005.1 ABC transporter substrate-binding protein [Bizionia algoritergicola]